MAETRLPGEVPAPVPVGPGDMPPAPVAIGDTSLAPAVGDTSLAPVVAGDTSLANVALRCLCPRCGRAGLFTRLLVLRPRCPACGLDLEQMDVGDAMAVPLLIVVGAIAVGLAFWLEFSLHPPLWVHMVVWPVVVVPLTIALMRPSKAFLVAQQYRTQIREAE